MSARLSVAIAASDCLTVSWWPNMSMLINYLITAYNVYTRRKLYTAINLACITLTLVVLLVITALLQNTFYPTGVEFGTEGRK